MTYLTKITQKKFFWPVVLAVLALVVGLLYIAPPLALRKHFVENGQRFVLAQFKTYRNSLYHYLPRAREIYDGHFPPSDLAAGQQDSPTINNLLPSSIFAALLKIFNGSTNRAYLAAQLIFSALIFLAFALISWLLTRSKIWASFFGLVGVLTPIPLKLPFYNWHGASEFSSFFLNNFIPLARTQFDKLYYSLIDNPLLTTPFLLAAITASYYFWIKPSKKTAVLAAFASALLFYVYFHFWVYWVIVIGLLSIYVLAVKAERQHKLKLFILFWCILIVLAMPYLINYWRFSPLPNAEDFTFRLGVAHGRSLATQVWPDYLVYIGLIALTYWLYRKTDRPKMMFMIAAMAAFFIAWNVQLVIGYVPVPHTWYKVAGPIIYIVLGVLIFELISKFAKKEHWKKLLAGTLIVLSAFVVIKKIDNARSIYARPQQFLTNYYKFDNGIAKSWDWINENLPPEPRVITPSAVNVLYLTTYTSARPYMPTGFASMLPMAELEKRLLETHKLFGISQKDLENRLNGTFPRSCSGFDCFPDEGSNQNDIIGHIYANYLTSKYGNFQDFLGDSEGSLVPTARAERTEKLLEQYKDIKVSWKDVTADYVYYGPWERQIGSADLSSDPNLKLVYNSEGVRIYKVKR
ncbi:MAG: hypothetical protein Q8L24_02425 [bacterium]|nr:hypothetical protein [bacterium]